jgi:hypothetical protein
MAWITPKHVQKIVRTISHRVLATHKTSRTFTRISKFLEENVDGHRTFQKCPNGPEIEF